jgi:hypothetical protein
LRIARVHGKRAANRATFLGGLLVISHAARAGVVAWATSASIALAGDAGPWETITNEPILIQRRAVPGSDVKEIRAEGTVNANVLDVQEVLTNTAGFVKFMPYCVEAREIGSGDPDGAHYNYQRLDLPVLSDRDFIHKTYVDRDARTDPEHVFAIHWFSVPDKIPERSGVIRLRVSEGSWLFTPSANGGLHVVYRQHVDPGGMIPGFAANFANKDGIVDTFKAVEAEAHRRAEKAGASAAEKKN